MNIIEKLGITPGPWKRSSFINFPKYKNNSEEWKEKNRIEEKRRVYSIDGVFISRSESNFNNYEIDHNNAQVIAASPEMLEALIDIVSEMEPYHRQGMEDKGLYIKGIKVVQKATGKTWQEIKELI